MPQWKLPWLAFWLALALSYLLTPLVSKLATRFGASPCRVSGTCIKSRFRAGAGWRCTAAFLLTLGAIFVYIATHRHDLSLDDAST